MGNSVINYLQKVRDGVVFSEGFENDNFVTAEAWTTVQGVPTNSSSQSKQGIKSFICNGTASTLSIIKKVITPYSINSVTSNTPFTYAEVWFYDDMTTTAGTGPYFKVKTSSGKWFQVGVRNDISTTEYVCNAPNTYTQDNFSTTIVSTPTRSLGWHKFQIFLGFNGSTGFKIAIGKSNNDSQIVFQTGTAATGEVFSEVYVNSGTTSDTVGTFGFFDSLFVFLDEAFYVINQDSTDTNTYGLNAFVDGVSLRGPGTIPTPFVPCTDITASGDTYLYPLKTVIEISIANNTHRIGSYFNYDIYPGDIYEYKRIDLGRRFTSIQVNDNNLENQNKTISGVREVLSYSNQNRQTFIIDQLDEDSSTQWRQQADNFFYWTVLGNPFSVMVDEIEQNDFGVIKDFKQAGTTKRVFLNPNLSTNATDAFTAGDTCILQKQNNTLKEVVTIASLDTNSITFNEQLTFDVNSGDFVYSQYFFPFQQYPTSDMPGFQQVNAQNVRFTWTLNTEDFNGIQ